MSERSPEQELDAFFGPRPSQAQPLQRLGIVVGGSLSKGLDVKLDQSTVIEGLAVGRYVVVRGQTGRRFFSMVTDVQLDTLNPLIEKVPPEPTDSFLNRVYQGTVVFGRIHVSPMLVLGQESSEPKPVKTVPAHFTPVYPASEDEVALIFGQEEQTGYFYIGDPLEMEIATPRTDRERRHWLISNVLAFFESGGAMPPYMTHTIEALLDSIAEILVEHEEGEDEVPV